ncbi:MAG: DegT/DnrJ/EryC1/StrS family aminotransferase [Candidatus Bathyarchaeia archaeon]|jgi:dTDP-4-amino-4,6-dideoxygalactose transaminase
MPKLIRSSKPFFPQEDINPLLSDIGKVLENGQFRFGKNVEIFEDQTASYLGVDGAVAFDSDSSAYETALRFFGVEGKEVVVCTNSFISVPNSVLFAGGKVVFADIKADSLSMDPDSLESHLSPDTRGVIITHIAGFPNPDLQRIQEICRDRGLFLIEDATHAIGGSVFGKKVGGFGDAAVFSFTPTKVITTGEGGMLVSSDAELREFAKRYSFYGSGSGKTNFVNVGRHMVMAEISALLGIYQLKRLDEFVERRNKIAKAYDQAFKKIKQLKTVDCPDGTLSAYYKYPLILDRDIDRQQFAKALIEEYGVETGNIFYPPCHMQGAYRSSGGFSQGDLSVAEDVLSRTIALPVHMELSDEDVAFVINKVESFTRRLS